MALRDWRGWSILGISLLWILALSVWLSIKSEPLRREMERQNPGGDNYAIVHLPGGFLTVFGPPLILFATWWWLRRSRPPANDR